MINRSTAEDKNQPWALFSLQLSSDSPIIQCMGFMRWSSLMAGWLSLAVVFSMVMILPLCPRPQNGQPPCVSISLLKGDCWRLYYGVKKYFLLPSPPLKLFIPAPAMQQSLFIAVVFSRGMHQVWCRWFNTTLIQRQHLGCHNAAEEIKSCGLDSAHCFLVIMAPL